MADEQDQKMLADMEEKRSHVTMIADGDRTRCGNFAQCQIEFSFWNRRHHCRQCGEIFCAACCPNDYHFECPTSFRMCVSCVASWTEHRTKIHEPPARDRGEIKLDVSDETKALMEELHVSEEDLKNLAKERFEHFDKDHSGFLDNVELNLAINSYFAQLVATFPNDSVDETTMSDYNNQLHHKFQELDSDSDGQVTLDEFASFAVECYCKIQHLMKAAAATVTETKCFPFAVDTKFGPGLQIAERSNGTVEVVLLWDGHTPSSFLDKNEVHRCVSTRYGPGRVIAQRQWQSVVRLGWDGHSPLSYLNDSEVNQAGLRVQTKFGPGVIEDGDSLQALANKQHDSMLKVKLLWDGHTPMSFINIDQCVFVR